MGAGTHGKDRGPTDRWLRKSIDRPVPAPSTPSGEETCQAQRLAHRPRLERAAARCVRRVAVGDLREMSEARVVEVGEQRLEEAPTRLGAHRRRAAPDPPPGPDEPPPEPP